METLQLSEVFKTNSLKPFLPHWILRPLKKDETPPPQQVGFRRSPPSGFAFLPSLPVCVGVCVCVAGVVGGGPLLETLALHYPEDFALRLWSSNERAEAGRSLETQHPPVGLLVYSRRTF